MKKLLTCSWLSGLTQQEASPETWTQNDFLKDSHRQNVTFFYIKETSLLVASGEEVEHSGDPQHHPGNLYLILQIFLFSVKLSPRTSYTDQIHQKSRFLPRGSCIILNPECEEGGHD